MVALLVLLTFLVFFVVDYLVRKRQLQSVHQGRAATAPAPTPLRPIPLTPPVYRTPAGVYFEPGHTWLHLEEDGVAKLGIDDFARNVIGAIDEFNARAVGDKVVEGDEILRVRHGIRTIRFRAPVSGTIEEINTERMHEGELRSIEPYTDAWLYRIRPEDPSILARAMMIGTEAKDWLSREVNRLKVFLATLAQNQPALGETMQDGGLVVSGLVEYLDDLGWKKLEGMFFE